MLWLASLSEAYPGRFPSELLAEVRRLPVGLMDEVLEMRAFLATKRVYDRLGSYDDKTRASLLEDPLMQVIKDIDLELAELAVAQQKAGTDGV